MDRVCTRRLHFDHCGRRTLALLLLVLLCYPGPIELLFSGKPAEPYSISRSNVVKSKLKTFQHDCGGKVKQTAEHWTVCVNIQSCTFNLVGGFEQRRTRRIPRPEHEWVMKHIRIHQSSSRGYYHMGRVEAERSKREENFAVKLPTAATCIFRKQLTEMKE